MREANVVFEYECVVTLIFDLKKLIILSPDMYVSELFIYVCVYTHTHTHTHTHT
jgi:hypothetical protein